MVAALRIRPTILLFGDSLTQFGWGVDGNVGWAGLLASAYTRRADILNRGFSGYNTNHALDVLPRVLGSSAQEQEEPVLFCTVFLGANDAVLPGEVQHVPLEDYQSNLEKIVKAIRERVDTADVKVPIILMTPPPVDEKAWAAYKNDEKSTRENVFTRSYGIACIKVAADQDCAVVNVFDLLGGDSDDFQKHLSDGVHLSGSGNTLIYEGLMSVIKEKYPNLAPMDGDGKNEASGMPVEEALWTELC